MDNTGSYKCKQNRGCNRMMIVIMINLIKRVNVAKDTDTNCCDKSTVASI